MKDPVGNVQYLDYVSVNFPVVILSPSVEDVTTGGKWVKDLWYLYVLFL
jgi:hypothetical protein